MQEMMTPRGLRRASAAAYLGISPTTFDRLRAERKVPSPRTLRGMDIWDRDDLDAFFEDLPQATAPAEPAHNPWDEE
jgi:predicted DNA-binding transcriptional regulator AlpA